MANGGAKLKGGSPKAPGGPRPSRYYYRATVSVLLLLFTILFGFWVYSGVDIDIVFQNR